VLRSLPDHPNQPATETGISTFPFATLLRQLNLVVGPFGSGKTEIALNIALGAAALGLPITLVDLDTVTPALRSRQVAPVLRAAGVDLVAPAGQLAYADLPTVPGGVHGAISSDERITVVDVGGNPTGARVLGSLNSAISARSYHCWGVVSPWRPDASDPQTAGRSLAAVAAQGRIELTGLVGNLHLPAETTTERIRHGWRVIAATAAGMGLPVSLCAAEGRQVSLVRQVLDDEQDATGVPVLGLRLMMRPPWDAGPDDVAWHWDAEAPAPRG
jgi:hypothetical protein